MRIYLDMNIYNRPFDDQSQVRIRLETIAIFSIFQKVKNKEFKLLWSFMLEYENSLNPYADVKQEIEMAASLAFKNITPDETILNAAKELESRGIKPRDSIHLACALKGKAEYFLTCDDKLIKRAYSLDMNIKIINPLRFIEYMEVN
ncbi:MAG: PIN domain-containing protein [Nitrospiraceae bacterium]|nr:PIN domain-containing protein [Nitrospiraceae bacterium]MDA8222302.1 PIN domain-containing protein [Desulfitobacterium hafniense]